MYTSSMIAFQGSRPGYLDYPFQNKRFGHGSLAYLTFETRSDLHKSPCFLNG
jgi:hypothetical protein